MRKALRFVSLRQPGDLIAAQTFHSTEKRLPSTRTVWVIQTFGLAIATDRIVRRSPRFREKPELRVGHPTATSLSLSLRPMDERTCMSPRCPADRRVLSPPSRAPTMARPTGLVMASGFTFIRTTRDSRINYGRCRSKEGRPSRSRKTVEFYGIESEDRRLLYYSKYIQPGVWKIPLNGGDETLVLDQPPGDHWYDWAPTRDGIYFLKEEPHNGKIYFFDFATEKAIPIFALEKPAPLYGGLALSPDGKSLLFSQQDFSDFHIMLVKNFR